MSATVIVHIYESNLSVQPGPLENLGRAVAVCVASFHAGVEVYRKEYSYCPGSAGPHGKGVCHVPHRHDVRESIAMGETKLSSQEVHALIERLWQEWPGMDRVILRQNCCHFADEFCQRLGVGPLPDRVMNLVGIGADLRNGAKVIENLANLGIDKIVDMFQVPQQFTDDIHQRSPRHANAKGSASSAIAIRDTKARVEKPRCEPSIGDRIEVFSNSCQVWCAARVNSINNNNPTQKMVTVAFRTPGAAPHEISYKDLPLDSKELRCIHI